MKYEIPEMLSRAAGLSSYNFIQQDYLSEVGFRSAYSASKAGIVSLSKVAALEYADHGLRINVICRAPGHPCLNRYLKLNPEAEASFGRANANGPDSRPGRGSSRVRCGSALMHPRLSPDMSWP